MTKKNEYDNPQFFEAYAQMSRSQKGLEGAGEWHQLKVLFPPLYKKRVLDLGCGYGWHCLYAIEQGAKEVLGLDMSEKMIAQAKIKNKGDNIEYRLCDIENYDFPKERWDVVISNLVLHYIEDIESIFQKISRTLTSNGMLVLNIEHPTFTAGVNQDWIYNEKNEPLYWPVDNYFISGERKTQFLGCEVVKQHHTLEQIFMGLIRQGFEIEAVIEAQPPKEMLALPEMKEMFRRPMMLLVKARKK